MRRVVGRTHVAGAAEELDEHYEEFSSCRFCTFAHKGYDCQLYHSHFIYITFYYQSNFNIAAT